MSALPSHYGMTFTPTIHATIPANTDPSTTQLAPGFVAVVTGAGKGLGYQIALSYAKAGCSGLSISSRTPADLDKLESAIAEIRGVEVLKSVCDVQSEQSVRALVEEVAGRWGRVDVVVANAGVISRYVEGDGSGGESAATNLPVGIIQDEDWGRVLDINLSGTWRISTLTPLSIRLSVCLSSICLSTTPSIPIHPTD